jgi:hypothetical protein
MPAFPDSVKRPFAMGHPVGFDHGAESANRRRHSAVAMDAESTIRSDAERETEVSR